MFVDGTAPTLEELSSGLFDSGSFNVTHVTVDQTTGRLYVDAVNRLCELSPSLGQICEVVTGPHPDNPCAIRSQRLASARNLAVVEVPNKFWLTASQ